ncbi:MAG: class I adenylate-forming enzyme family protein [Streptomyces sp.]|uniref:class I adenylate-forming enzyme family protein n=1 Tax=Streptomyces sp. TaxID=1931 RepID=UPI003D6AE2AB
MAMDLGTVLRWTAERYPQRRAVGGRAPMTYREWDAHTNRLARALADLGVRPRERVVLSMAGGEPLASLHLAAQKIGAVSVPLSFRFGASELAYCVSDAEPTLVITDATTSAVATEALSGMDSHGRIQSGDPAEPTIERLALTQPDGPVDVRVSEQDISVMLYTSGTTGKPKGVPRTHSAEHHAAVAHLLQSGQSTFDATLGVMPLFHTMGLRTLVATIVGSGTWVPQMKFDADETLALITEQQISSLYLVPTIYWSLLRTGRLAEARSVRKLAYAGSSMTPALAGQLTETLQPASFVNHFGSTEIYTFTIGPDVVAKPGCAGRAGVFSKVRLVEPAPGASPDALVGSGEQGQVAVSMRSPEAFAGYWRRPDANAKSIRDGWYFPGDLAVADEDGDLWVSGRVDEMINSGGENIYPDEIEDKLIRCPAVSEVVVVGLSDDRWGQAATAFFVPDSGMAPDHAVAALGSYVRESSGLPSLKRPKRLIAVDEIPKSGSGKILRRQLSSGDYRPLADSDAAADR